MLQGDKARPIGDRICAHWSVNEGKNDDHLYQRKFVVTILCFVSLSWANGRLSGPNFTLPHALNCSPPQFWVPCYYIFIESTVCNHLSVKSREVRQRGKKSKENQGQDESIQSVAPQLSSPPDQTAKIPWFSKEELSGNSHKEGHLIVQESGETLIIVEEFKWHSWVTTLLPPRSFRNARFLHQPDSEYKAKAIFKEFWNFSILIKNIKSQIPLDHEFDYCWI